MTNLIERLVRRCCGGRVLIEAKEKDGLRFRIDWRRRYHGVDSDQRTIESTSLKAALEHALDLEEDE